MIQALSDALAECEYDTLTAAQLAVTKAELRPGAAGRTPDCASCHRRFERL